MRGPVFQLLFSMGAGGRGLNISAILLIKYNIYHHNGSKQDAADEAPSGQDAETKQASA